ncbi:hypothetical protein E2C01_083321 [Portunus trituberculatus]|uniref:Uncharacterized protein n=1 Tax=Portunus trituberculatus TaxID=210409 RepID=A0A5B7J1F9_PORTR|nr:hypothetical protein [Portunus trituberculatus]
MVGEDREREGKALARRGEAAAPTTTTNPATAPIKPSSPPRSTPSPLNIPACQITKRRGRA